MPRVCRNRKVAVHGFKHAVSHGCSVRVYELCQGAQGFSLQAQGLMVSIAREVTARLAGAEAGSFSRQHLANLIWAFATLEVRTADAARLLSRSL